jgi:hypothetical protein
VRAQKKSRVDDRATPARIRAFSSLNAQLRRRDTALPSPLFPLE